jgi:uncharacterized membrane protein
MACNEPAVDTGRVEAFSDGVIAVIITIMVLDLHVPHDAHWAALKELTPEILIYALSFVTVGIFWINHHHMMHSAIKPDPPLLWSNLALLFTMSLVPFVTAFVASAHDTALPVALYAVVLTFSSASFSLLSWVIAMQQHDPEARRVFLRFNRKGSLVIALYLVSIPAAYISVNIAYAIFIVIPILYVLPERAFAVR